MLKTVDLFERYLITYHGKIDPAAIAEQDEDLQIDRLLLCE